MLPYGSRMVCMMSHMFPELYLYNADPAQHLTTEGYHPDDYLDRDFVLQRGYRYS